MYMENLQHLTKTNSSWITEMYQRSRTLVEVVAHGYDTYLIETKTEDALNEWFRAESKGKWFHANKSELEINRVYN